MNFVNSYVYLTIGSTPNMKLYPLILILFFFQLIEAQVTPAEKAALQAFYDATDGPNWDSETDGDTTNDWDFTGPVTDDWYGLTLTGGHVVGIDMNPTDYFNAGNIQSGYIPDELADLEFLTVLDISGCGLSGNFPVSLTTLSNLTSLNLWNNDLDGEIPIEVTDMVQLTNLNLSRNNFTGYIYPEYGNLINLRYLLLSDNELTGTIPDTIGNLTSLYVLSLGSQLLTGELPVSLRNLVNLRELSIDATYISGNIPPEYGEMISLETLNLTSYSSTLDGGLTGPIPDSFGNLVNLNSLNLWGNALSGSIPESLSNLTDLQYFNIANNEISGTFSPSFSNWTDIDQILAFNNNIEGEIPDTYSSFSQIKIFMVNDNALSGELPASLSQWSNIIIFDIRNNEFTGSLPASFSQWTNVESISVSNNNMEGTMPDFTTNVNLETFAFNDNRFQFGDFEDEFDYYDQSITGFYYSPQAKVNDTETFDGCVGSSLTLSTVVSGSANVYQWFKDGAPISGATDADLVLDPLSVSDAGVYTCEITSTIVTGLTLERNPITVTVNEDAPTANLVSDILGCDLDADGFAQFNIDLADIASQAIGSQTGVSVSYFDASGNPLTLADPYTNTVQNEELITVRVSNASGCYGETVFSLIATQPVTADTLGDVVACDSYTLPELNPGNTYFTQANANGSQLRAGDIIDSSQTIYIHTGVGDCADETSFNVTIDPPVAVDRLEDVTECEMFVLPALTNGQYYTESGGEGISLNEGDSITETTTVYIYNQSGACSDESSFTVTIDLLACEDSAESIRSKFPKFFTPNQDGANDTWKVDQEFFALEGTITIYDRYGKLLAQFDAVNGSWDGTLNGRRLQASDYWFKFEEKDGKTIITGHFSLVR